MPHANVHNVLLTFHLVPELLHDSFAVGHKLTEEKVPVSVIEGCKDLVREQKGHKSVLHKAFLNFQPPFAYLYIPKNVYLS